MKSLGIYLLLVGLLSACSVLPEKPVASYRLAGMQHVLKLKQWYFEGRLAVANDKDSITAAVNWRHQLEKDEIELAGPLSQGRVAILVTADRVIVDDGEKKQVYTGSVDAVLSGQIGIDIPVSALKSWVLGVNDPDQSFAEQDGGFEQGGWLIKYKEMQWVNDELLPKKINVEKGSIKIKLIVDQWDLS